ncbi:MAG: hypothetical protein FD187_2400 [bacterium]|nr:MAG: hypothetical protein FD142_2825 [bacterium]KAF0147835.1 MAG: hypothetical protein FD187_2400 [bacterium]KAF0167437.1 MAG: hypothetical protein FD158_2219 [bacterium]
MKPPADFSPRRPALALLAAVVLGGGVVYWALGVHGERAAEAAAAQQILNAATEAARLAPDKLARDRAQTALHQRILDIGFVGEEDRAAWVTALAVARANLNLDSLSWRLAPRAESPLMPGLRVSVLELSAGNLDRAGLEALLARMRAEEAGFFTVERCALQFPADAPSGQAECRLLWWTWPETGDAR